MWNWIMLNAVDISHCYLLESHYVALNTTFLDPFGDGLALFAQRVLTPRQNRRHFADDNFNQISL